MRDKRWDPFPPDAFLLEGEGIITVIDAFTLMDGDPTLEVALLEENGEKVYSLITLWEWRQEVVPFIVKDL